MTIAVYTKVRKIYKAFNGEESTNNNFKTRKENKFMETNEIIKNEEVVETTTEEIAKASTGKGIKVAAGIGLGVLAGVIIYKYVAKPVIANIKAKKAEQNADEFVEFDDESIENERTIEEDEEQ